MLAMNAALAPPFVGADEIMSGAGGHATRIASPMATPGAGFKMRINARAAAGTRTTAAASDSSTTGGAP